METIESMYTTWSIAGATATRHGEGPLTYSDRPPEHVISFPPGAGELGLTCRMESGLFYLANLFVEEYTNFDPREVDRVLATEMPDEFEMIIACADEGDRQHLYRSAWRTRADRWMLGRLVKMGTPDLETRQGGRAQGETKGLTQRDLIQALNAMDDHPLNIEPDPAAAENPDKKHGLKVSGKAAAKKYGAAFRDCVGQVSLKSYQHVPLADRRLVSITPFSA